MYAGLLHTHSVLRFLVLFLLLLVVIKAFLGLANKKVYGKTDNLLGLLLFSVTHTQLLIALMLYYFSSFVKFSSETMKDPNLRYWTVEHITMMLISIVLITMSRITVKKLPDDAAKHKRTLLFNGIALIIILVAIAMSKRGFFMITGNPGV